MTTIKRPVRRETATEQRDAGKRQPIVLTIHPNYLEIGLKGMRRKMTLDYGAIYSLACKQEAARIRLEKLEAKKARKRGKENT